MNWISSYHYLCILFITSINFHSTSCREKTNKIYDYMATVVNGGGIGDADIIDAFGRLIGLTDPTHGPQREWDRIVTVFSRRAFELMDVINSTKPECRNEIRAALVSLATLSLAVSHRCASYQQNESELMTCSERKKSLVEDHVWVAKMMNAWGMPTSGLFAQGQFLWHGSYHQCLGTNVPQRGSRRRESARYCLVTIGPSFEEWAVVDGIHQQGGNELRFHLGVCLPPSCVDNDESLLLSSVLDALVNGSGELPSQMHQALSTHRIFCQLQHLRPFTCGQVILLVLISVLILLVVTGTIIDYRVRYVAEKRRNEKRMKRLLESFNDKGSVIDNTLTTASVDWLESIKSQIDLESVISFKSRESLRRSIRRLNWWLRFFTAFSVRMNVGWLASSRTTRANGERPCNRITCLYGIRVITMIWVILGHTYVFAMPHLSNLIEATERMPVQFLSQIILNSSLSVDTFYLISGLLNCYMWCIRHRSRRDGNNGLKRMGTWLAYFGHRYARLVPPYMLIIGFVVSGLFGNSGYGPKWEPDRISGIQCDRNTWWRHLLFVNNLVSGGERCLPWMWQLAIDMQCYLVAPLFIALLWKRPKIGCAVTIFVVASSALARGVVIGMMRLPTNLMLFLPTEHFHNDFYVYFDLIYQKPYFRCGPYMIGLLTGWMLAVKTEELRMWHRLSLKAKIFTWILITAFCSWPLFGLYPLLTGRFFSSVYNGIYAGINRTIWSIGVAMIVVSCHCGFGCSYLNSVFSWIGWWPFARLSYGVYLVHELLIIYVFFNLRSPITYDGHASLLAYFAFFSAISYAASLILFIIVEGPSLAAERLLFRRRPNSSNTLRRPKKDTNGKEEVKEVAIVDRLRMTERWSVFVTPSGRKTSPSGVQLYEYEDGEAVHTKVLEEEVANDSVLVGVDESMQVSLDEMTVPPSVTSGVSTGKGKS